MGKPSSKQFTIVFLLFLTLHAKSQVTLTSTNLPIVKINTKGQKISDTVKIVADMGITWHGTGVVNSITDESNDYNGKINIKYRGTSSLEFPKKPYKIETIDDAGDEINVPILGMPQENDWVLIAPYNDKSLIRDVLTLELYSKMRRYSPRARFCELVLNGNYIGVYVLAESVKRDKNRIDIAKLQPTENSGDDLTGGYIIKVDRPESNEPTWESLTYSCSDGSPAFNYLYDYPKSDEITETQSDYIRNYLYSFESALTSSNYTDPFFGYNSYIDAGSFVDYILISELSKDADRYKYSVFMYKDKESNGGKLTLGPIWDSNLGYGNSEATADSFCTTRHWCYTPCYKMYWFRRLMEDPAFVTKLNIRWNSLRKNAYSNGKVSGIIDSLSTMLATAQERNFQKWPILGKYVWPNQFIGQTFNEEIDFVKNWTLERMAWMDAQLPDTIDTEPDRIPEFANADFRLFPNPFSSGLRLECTTYNPVNNLTIEIYNVTGTKITSIPINVYSQHISADLFQLQPGLQYLNRGIYIAKIYFDGNIIKSVKLIKE